MSADVAVDARLGATLDAGASALGIALPEGAREALMSYIGLLAKWNRTYNLTAIREPDRMVTHHLLDSLAAIPAIEARLCGATNAAVLDVGSGAGLPGVPLAIARPGWHVTMLEPVHKKAAFIAQAIAELRLRNATAIARRVEDHSDARYAIVISRAFADLASFAASSARHVAPRGFLVAMKGVHPDEELVELPSEFVVTGDVRLSVPGVDGARHLIFLQRSRA